jgi:hypothetical protein
MTAVTSDDRVSDVWSAEPYEFPELPDASSPASNWVPGLAAAGAFAALGMIIGALGPWAHVSLIDYDGVEGIGVVSFGAGVVALVGNAALVFHPRRGLATAGALAAGVALIVAVAAWGLIVVFSNSTGLIVAALGRRGVPKIVGSLADVSVGWGLVMTAVSALVVAALALLVRMDIADGSTVAPPSELDASETSIDPLDAAPDPWS